MPTAKPNVAALVSQMPETDRDLREQAPKTDPSAQAEARAERWGAASKFTGPDPAAAEKVFAEILNGGRASILELLALVRAPSDSDYQDYKAGYVLHGVCLAAGRPGQERQRKLLAQSLAGQLGSDSYSKAVKGSLIRELQAVGRKEAVSALGRQLLDSELGEAAAQALLVIREGAVGQFRKALPSARGRNRVTILLALGTLRDGASAGAFKRALSEEDREVRRAAAWALANIGEASAADLILQFADGREGWERSQATGFCLLLAERLAASGRQTEATRIYTHLRDTRTDPTEGHVKEAAEQALKTWNKVQATR